jgi:hypothetical protein
VSGVLGSSPRCLCMVLGGTAATLGVAMDSARTLQLPAACRVQPPPASQCDCKFALHYCIIKVVLARFLTLSTPLCAAMGVPAAFSYPSIAPAGTCKTSIA